MCVHGVDGGRRGERPNPSSLIELLDVFGEDGLRSYLMGFAEGREDAQDEQVLPYSRRWCSVSPYDRLNLSCFEGRKTACARFWPC
jgi:hypothetical protein